MNDIYAARLLEAMERIATSLEAQVEYAQRQEKLQDEYRAKEAEDGDDEYKRHNDLWERQLRTSEERLEVEKLHNEMHLRGTAHT